MHKNIFQSIRDSQLFFSPLPLVILFNLLPLAGVLFLDWRTLDLLCLYALENFIILIFSCLKFRLAAFDYLYIYFYAAFCAMQMFFLLNLLGDMGMINGYDKSLSFLDLSLLIINQENLYFGLVIMLLSYTIDLICSTAWSNKWFNNQSEQLNQKRKINPLTTRQKNRFGVNSIYLSSDIKIFERLGLMQITLIVGGALLIFFKTAFFTWLVLLGLKLSLEIAARLVASAKQNQNAANEILVKKSE